MKVVDMLSDYQQMLHQAESVGVFAAYKAYTDKYPELFGPILDYLYMADLDALRPMIENVDFNDLLNTAKSNRSMGLSEHLIQTAEQAAAILDVTDDFTLYLGIELGNIGGFSGDPSRQMVFIGTEKHLSSQQIAFLIPHEINHMVRAHTLPNLNMFSFTERVITEGLGTTFALKYNQLPFSALAIANSLFISVEQAQILLDSTNSLLQELGPHFGQPLTHELMQAYFTFSNNDQAIVLQGYYLGMVICDQLLNAGYTIEALTRMPSDRIWSTFSELSPERFY